MRMLLELQFDEYITDYRQQLLDYCDSHTDYIEIADFKGKMTPAQAEIQRRTRDFVSGVQDRDRHCEACISECRETLAWAAAQINKYLENRLGGVIRAITVTYRSVDDGMRTGVSVMIMDDGLSVWAARHAHEVAVKLSDELSIHPLKSGLRFTKSMFPAMIGDFTLVGISTENIMFESEITDYK